MSTTELCFSTFQLLFFFEVKILRCVHLTTWILPDLARSGRKIELWDFNFFSQILPDLAVSVLPIFSTIFCFKYYRIPQKTTQNVVLPSCFYLKFLMEFGGLNTTLKKTPPNFRRVIKKMHGGNCGCGSNHRTLLCVPHFSKKKVAFFFLGGLKQERFLGCAS